jgi:hypothetical protein
MASEYVLSARHICRYAIQIIKKYLGNIRWWCCPVTEKRVFFSDTAEEVPLRTASGEGKRPISLRAVFCFECETTAGVQSASKKRNITTSKPL